MARTLSRSALDRYFLFATLALAMGCGQAGQGGAAAKAAVQDADLIAQNKATSPQKSVMPRKIIYKGEVTLYCEDLDKASAQLESRVKQFGAYVGNASRAGSKGEV